MKLKCPRCRSSQIKALNYGRKMGGIIGAITGVASGVVSSFADTTTHRLLGIYIRMPPTDTLVNALLRGLQAGVTGCSIGVTLGNMIDTEILSNHKCLSCKHRFTINKIYASPFHTQQHPDYPSE